MSAEDASTTPPSSISSAEARRAARNAGALAVASVLSKALLFGWQLILVPLLGPFDVGIFGTVAALFTIAAVIPNFGISAITIRDVARWPERAGGYLTAMLYLQMPLALLAYVGINLAAGALDYSETIRAFVALGGLSLLIDSLGNMCHDILLARERMVATSAVEVGHIAVRITLALLAVWAGFGLLGVYTATIISGIGRSALLWALVLRDDVRPKWPLERKSLAWPLLFNSVPLAVTGFLSLAAQQVDKLMTTRILGEADTGHLTVAFFIIFGVVNLLNSTILTATYPMMSRFHGDGRNPMFGFMVEKLTLFTLIINLPISLILSVFAAEITVPLFGIDFAPTADVLRILIWYALVTMAVATLSRALVVQNRQRVILVIRALGLALNIVLNLALLPRIGVRGAAIASVVSEILVVLALGSVSRAEGLRWSNLLPRLVRLGGLGGLMALALGALGSVNIVLAVAGGLTLYVVGVLLGRVLADDDWDLLYRLVAALPGGSQVRKYWRRNVELNW